jgi:quercetin dioxygenase-like cupin family protein
MTVKEYKDGDVVLVRHIPGGDAWQKPLQFYSPDTDFIQVGTWSYDAGKELLAHTHKLVPRTFEWTQEVLYICKGSIRAHVYDCSLKKVDEIVAKEGDIVVMLAGGHGYDILEDGTRVIEIKNGPYVGPEADRVRLKDTVS